MDEGVPVDGRSDEHAELAALRRRAYSADADIADDPAALARLAELEDRARLSRAREADRHRPNDSSPVPAAAVDAPPPRAGMASPTAGATSRAAEWAPATAERRPRRRWHTALVAGTAAVAVALGTAAWSEQVVRLPAGPDASGATVGAGAPGGDTPPPSPDKGYEAFLDRLRDDVLASASPQVLASRIMHSELRPYGAMNGRAVWAGPTIDGALCLIVGNDEAPVIVCGYPETVERHGISIVLPAAYTDDAVEAVFPPGQSIRYTLGAGLSVTTQPAVD